MSKLIRKLLSAPAFGQQKRSATPGDCNYNNNYYGDQVCRPAPARA